MTYIYCTFLTEFNTLIPSQITGKRLPRHSPYQLRHHLMAKTIVYIWGNNNRVQCLGTLLDRNLITYPFDCWNTTLMLRAEVRCDNDTHEYIRIKNPKPEDYQISRGVNIIESEVSNFYILIMDEKVLVLCEK